MSRWLWAVRALSATRHDVLTREFRQGIDHVFLIYQLHFRGEGKSELRDTRFVLNRWLFGFFCRHGLNIKLFLGFCNDYFSGVLELPRDLGGPDVPRINRRVKQDAIGGYSYI
jgi:hypothetical protein